MVIQNQFPTIILQKCNSIKISVFLIMTIPCKPEAGLIIKANALYVLNVKSQGSITWSDPTGKNQGLPNFLMCSREI